VICAFLLYSSTCLRAFLLCSSNSLNIQHFPLCASLLYSSTASRGKVPKISTLCLHVYVFLLCISIVFLLFSAYYPVLFQHYFSMMHCISLCISNDCEASQSHPYDQKSKPITATKEVKPFYYAYSNQRSETFTFCLMMIKLLLHFLLHFGSNSFKNKRHGPIRNPFDKMPPDFKTSWRDLYDEICSIGPNIERIMSIFSLWDPCAS